jgi:hypothetical protein
MERMSEFLPWERIYKWLDANAPGTFSQITAPSGTIGRWRLAGATNLFPSMFTPLSSRDSIRERARLRHDVYPELDHDPAGTMSSAFLEEFVPIAEDGGGDYLFIDGRPGVESGCVREWCRDDGNLGATLWPSVHAMLADVAHSLETGEPALRGHVEAAQAQFFKVAVYAPEVRDGVLSWQSVRT